MYSINVAAKLELFLGYSVVDGYPVFPGSYKVIFGGLETFFVNQDYNQDCKLFTEEGVTGYIMQVSLSLPALSPTLVLSSPLTVSGNAFPNGCEYFPILTVGYKSVCCRNSEKRPCSGLLQDCL